MPRRPPRKILAPHGLRSAPARRPLSRTLRAYLREADAYIRHWARRRYRAPPLLLALLRRLPRGAVVLDAGCGPGQDARYLGRRVSVVGLDLCEPFLRFGRRRDASLPLVRADLRAVPLKPGSLDGIWAAASLIHLRPADVTRTCARWRDLVRGDGLLAATLVHGRTSGVTRSGWIPGRYVSRWRKAALRRMVERAGWEVLVLETVTHRERKGRWLNLIARKTG